MSVNMKPIAIQETPITKTTFELQGWEKIREDDGGSKYHYWILPLPKDNPDENCAYLISSANDEYKELGIPKGNYFVEIEGLNGLGFCQAEEEIEILYRSLTGLDIYEELEESDDGDKE